MAIFGFGRPSLDPRRGYKKTLKVSDFFSSDKSTVADEYVILGYYTVGAGQIASVGQGLIQDDPMEQGRPYIKLQDTTPAVQTGFIKITHESAQGTRTQKIVEERSEEFNQSTRSERLTMPVATSLGFNPVGEDAKIGLYFKADSSGTVGNDESEIILPITVWE